MTDAADKPMKDRALVEATVQPLGVSPKWMNVSRRSFGHHKRGRDELLASSERELQTFIGTGVIPPPEPDLALSDAVEPPRLDWENHLHSSLGMYANAKLRDFETNSLANNAWDISSAQAAVEAERLRTLIRVHIATLFPQRYGGRQLRTLWPSDTAVAALGIVLRPGEDSFDAARLHLTAYRRGWTHSTEYFPLYIFMLRILADHLGEPPLLLAGEPAREPYTNDLYDAWRTTDLETLTALCLAVCDFHTHRCTVAPASVVFHEFQQGKWTRCPIEILLLLKLRELTGLPNPELRHPLTDTALGRLPPPIPWTHDPLLEQVHARLRADGLDEANLIKGQRPALPAAPKRGLARWFPW
ncbi:MAG: hypothetical protein REJ23_05295 [Brevundimonas sp.]|nr:hypothetical protein [Brevundimonas sp.]